MIKSVPEVTRVFGKAVVPDTATDPAPLLNMCETTIHFKARDPWRPGNDAEITGNRTRQRQCRCWPGQPVDSANRNRIDMSARHQESKSGSKVYGFGLYKIDKRHASGRAHRQDGPRRKFGCRERLTGDAIIDVALTRSAAARLRA